MNFRKIGTNRGFQVILLIFLSVFLGFLRDFIFKSVNALLKAWDYDQDYYISPALSFLENFEYQSLVNLKWLLTIVFAGLYLVITIFGLRLFFRESYTRLCLLTYGLLVLTSGLFMLTGYLFSDLAERMYEFSRFMMGLAQSPIILMILIPAILLIEKEKNKTRRE